MKLNQATTIEEVIKSLDEIISKSKIEQNPIGLFAALYRQVTIKIKEGIINGEFSDGARMEKLDVIFANRYLTAYYQFQANESPSSCWELSFKQASNYWPIVVQHLLFGISAHVNLDLGIACAQVSTIDNIESLKSDFDKINTILSNLVGSVEKALAEVWPTLTFILKHTGSIDNFFIDFSMKMARDGAWKFANEFVALKEDQWDSAIKKRDEKITKVAQLISNPDFIVGLLFKIIRLGEIGTVTQKIEEIEDVNYKLIDLYLLPE